MISFITGKPGGGKGLLAMQQIIDELVSGKRSIITNLPVRVQPWVGGSWQPMIGLKQYLLKKYGKDFDCEKRVFVLKDEQADEFFLYRAVSGKLVKVHGVYKEKGADKRLVEFGSSGMQKTGSVLYCIDEAWKFWSSRNWQRTGEGMQFYGAQHRHFGDDVLICTQHTKQIDQAIQRVAQDFWVVRNHGKMTFGFFRQPAVFSVCIYDQAPTGASITPMSRKMFTLDRMGLAQTYDTSAGVGLSGRMMADVGTRKKGFAWWWAIILVFGSLLLLWWLLRFGGHVVTKGLLHGGKSVVKQEEKLVKGSLDAGSPPGHEKKDLQVIGKTNVADGTTNKVWCIGYSVFPGRALVLLSDGRIADSLDNEVQKIYKRKVLVFGGEYEVRRRDENNAAGVAAKNMTGGAGAGGSSGLNKTDVNGISLRPLDDRAGAGIVYIGYFTRPNVDLR